MNTHFYSAGTPFLEIKFFLKHLYYHFIPPSLSPSPYIVATTSRRSKMCDRCDRRLCKTFPVSPKLLVTEEVQCNKSCLKRVQNSRKIQITTFGIVFCLTLYNLFCELNIGNLYFFIRLVNAHLFISLFAINRNFANNVYSKLPPSIKQ